MGYLKIEKSQKSGTQIWDQNRAETSGHQQVHPQWVYGPCEHPAAAPTTQARYFSCWAHCFASLCFGTVVLFSGCLSIPVQLVLQNCRTPSNGCGGPPTSTCATHTHTHTQWVYGPCECPTAAPQTQAFVFRFEFIFLQVCVSFLFGTGSPILGPKLVPILGPNLVPGRFVLDSECVQGWSQFWSQIWDRIWSQNSEPFFH